MATRKWIALCLASLALACTAGAFVTEGKKPSLQTERWSRLPKESFEHAIDGLHIPDGLGVERTVELKGELSRLIAVVRASDFREYCEAITGIRGVVPKLSADGAARIFRSADGLALVSSTAQAAESEVLEKYWLYFTEFGSGRRFFTGYIPTMSGITVTAVPRDRYHELETLSYFKQIQQAHDHSGIVALTSAFERGDTLTNYTKSTDSLSVAIIKLTVTTEVTGLAYPIIVRYFWSDKLKIWIPFDSFQLFAGNRIDFIF